MKWQYNSIPNSTAAIGSNTRENNDVLFSALESVNGAHFNVAKVSAINLICVSDSAVKYMCTENTEIFLAY